MEEPFQRGDLVTVRDEDPEPIGRIVSISPGGEQAEVVWHKRRGREHDVTREATVWLRRLHESELSADEP
jgi:hypothetical protein